MRPRSVHWPGTQQCIVGLWQLQWWQTHQYSTDDVFSHRPLALTQRCLHILHSDLNSHGDHSLIEVSGSFTELKALLPLHKSSKFKKKKTLNKRSRCQRCSLMLAWENILPGFTKEYAKNATFGSLTTVLYAKFCTMAINNMSSEEVTHHILGFISQPGWWVGCPCFKYNTSNCSYRLYTQQNQKVSLINLLLFKSTVSCEAWL